MRFKKTLFFVLFTLFKIPAFEMSPGLSESECRSVEDDQSRTENTLEDEKEDVVEDVVDSPPSPPPPSGYEIKTDSESGEKYYVNIFTGLKLIIILEHKFVSISFFNKTFAKDIILPNKNWFPVGNDMILFCYKASNDNFFFGVGEGDIYLTPLMTQ